MCLTTQTKAQNDSLAINSPSYYSAPNILRFADFLWKQGDFVRAAAEYQRYLFNNLQHDNPYVYFQLGSCYLRASLPEEAVPYFTKAVESCQTLTFRDTASAALASALLLSQRNEEFLVAVDTIKTYSSLPFLKSHLLALKGLYFLERQQWQNALATLTRVDSTSNFIENRSTIASLILLADRGMDLPRKSPWIAGLMSTVIPGSGKIYTRRTGEGLYSLLLIAGSSWLAYEGFHDNGISSFKGWLFGSAATFLHVGNIYGSVVAVRFYNERFEQRLANDIQTHIVLRTHF